MENREEEEEQPLMEDELLEDRDQSYQAKDKVEPITEEEILEAKDRIEKLHPMAMNTLEQVFPNMCSCLSCCNKRKHQERQKTIQQSQKNIMQQLKQIEQDMGFESIQDNKEEEVTDDQPEDQLEDKEAIKQNPYYILGFGIVAYFNLQQTFIAAFFIMALIALIICFQYSQFTGLENNSWTYYYTQFSLGNLGFSTSTCDFYYAQLDQEINFECKSGNHISQLHSVGLIPNNYQGNLGYSFCGNTEQADKEIEDCQTLISDQFYSDFKEKCIEQNSCNGFFIEDIIASNNEQDNKCYTGKARLYMQYFCEVDEVMQNVKVEVSQAVIVYVFLIIVVYYYVIIQQSSTVQQELQKWDVNTATAGDFTVQYVINQKMWKKFINHSDSNQYQNKFFSFKQFLKSNIEVIVQERPQVFPDYPTEINIAHITLAFSNGDIIKYLDKRGQQIINGNLKQAEKLEKKINEKLTNIKEKIRPVKAFITFENQEGYERACKIESWNKYFCFKKQAEETLLEVPLHFKPAPEPTNIIWENLHVSSTSQNVRKVFAFAMVSIFLLASFTLFYLIKRYAIDIQLKYPQNIECQKMNDIFEGDDDKYQTYAKIDQYSVDNYESTGLYQCYCEGHMTEEFCNKYLKDQLWIQLLQLSISAAIVIVNMILVKICMSLIQMIGYHNITIQTRAVMISTFISQFFNTALLVLICNTNTIQGDEFRIFPLLLHNSDLTYDWYQQIGTQLVTTMIFMIASPIIMFFTSYGVKLMFRIFDKGFCRRENQTKCTTVQKYVDLYSGGIYLIHYKYSAIMNVIFVTFMYGIAIPFLFVIALVFFIVFYIVEKLVLTYHYQKPPMYDEKIHLAALRLLKYAPIGMLIFGYCSLRTKQIFENKVVPIQSQFDSREYNHEFFNVDQSLLLQIGVLVLLALIMLRNVLRKIFEKLGMLSSEDLEEADEKLGTYFQCMTPYQKKVWSIEERILRKKFNIQTMDEKCLTKLNTVKIGKRQFKNSHSHNYEITANRIYANRFQYPDIEFRNNQFRSDNSDFILRCINIPYQKDEEDEFEETCYE